MEAPFCNIITTLRLDVLEGMQKAIICLVITKTTITIRLVKTMTTNHNMRTGGLEGKMAKPNIMREGATKYKIARDINCVELNH